jgi:hypothetical protein
MTTTELFSETRDLCDADSTSYPDTALLRRVNSAIETLVTKIHQVCSNFDDENIANIAEGTITLEEGISKYTITDRFLDILSIKVKDVSGFFRLVEPWEQKDTTDAVETLEAQTGLPYLYRLVGRTIFLAPAPTAVSVTLTAGLKLSYTRTSYTITASDVSTGTLVPGLATPWHITIAKMAALPYCKTYKKDRVNQMTLDIQTETNDLINFYANRQKDQRTIITTYNRCYK